MHAKLNLQGRRSGREHCGPSGRGRGRNEGFDGDRHLDRRGPFGRRGEFESMESSGRRGGIGHGSRRGKRFGGDELRLMILRLLEEGPQHGYQLIRAFAERSNEAYSPSPGVLYPLLTMLQDLGLVEEAPGEGRTRDFILTDAGKAEVETNREKAESALARLAAMGEEAARGNVPQVRRAMMNLRNATMQRLSGGNEDPSLVFAIVDVIDEAARRIERL